MAWLLHESEVLASLEIADRLGERVKGLLGREKLEGALLVRPAKSVHTIGLRFPIDVAFVDREMRVLRLDTLRRHRVSRVVFRAHAVIEAEAGSFAHWGVRVGDELEIRP